MAFAKAIIRQVGRDLGKVISNQLFRDSHSTPYRRVGRRNRVSIQQTSQIPTQPTQTQTQTEELTSAAFDKAIGFATTFTAPTMVRKLMGVYEVINNEIFKAKKDGFIDSEEAKLIFTMEQEFHHKAEIIADLLELDEAENEKHLEKLEKVVRLTSGLFHETLNLAIKGAEIEKQHYLEQQRKIQPIEFGNYIGLHFILMGTYAKTGKKQLWKTILGNLVSVFLMFFFYVPLLNLAGLVQGLVTYASEKSGRDVKINILQQEIDLAEKQKGLYKQVIQETENLAKDLDGHE
ncbi:hypothetical protein [Psychroflexus planctonicus]|uniref:Uncharacterized protein n=1 Tax=Psychroflexus planctonicus TaxID=1526575 RepID=A0ABQ1SFS6_9FLAO|nr:hypothetical protein [Psychroflexus planctonicus]GGE37470.1 hypothetical protein GCM10010832_17120 [Psychroflexus planctonicus]